MRRRLRQTDSAGLRALVLYAALACLCVSDGIGPRLIPFPASSPHLSPARAGFSHYLDDFGGRPAAPSATSPPFALKLSKAGDAFKKTPVFSAPDFALPRTALPQQTKRHYDYLHTHHASLRLRCGRAPPILA
jgi:hypothetical protein